ncbi:MAG: RHS repeat-associated core domain-containing protein [Armatimonadetes bacterium]|nr:RHS repeat-associated core domain-containing protein [Armatimonadota bacterium]
MKKVADLTITWNPGDENQGSGFYDENLSVNKPTTRYYYDGQMCIEEDYTVWVGPFQGQSTVVTRYGVGARGIDWMEKSGSGGGVSFPLYDGHGNMIATLSRSGSASYAVSNARGYDVWGSVRSGASSGYPNTRYCANLGHKQDDESGLIYMRARYYEPCTGRFVTEDPARDGINWFVYCQSDCVRLVDPAGEMALSDIEITLGEEAALQAAHAHIGRAVYGKAVELALYIQARYFGLTAALTGWGTSRAGEFVWEFTSSLGTRHLFRFNLIEGVLKHNSTGVNFGIHHKMNLQKFMSEFLKWAADEGFG